VKGKIQGDPEKIRDASPPNASKRETGGISRATVQNNQLWEESSGRNNKGEGEEAD